MALNPATIGTMFNILGTGSSIAGEFTEMQGKSQAESFNGDVKRQQAAATRNAAEFEKGKLQRYKASVKGAHEANIAKAGLRFEGSPMEHMAANLAEIELDIMSTEYNAQIQISQLEYEANQHKSNARHLNTQSYIKAATSLLGVVDPSMFSGGANGSIIKTSSGTGVRNTFVAGGA